MKFSITCATKAKQSKSKVFTRPRERNKKLNVTNENLAASRRNFESKGTSITLYSSFDATG